MIRRIVPALLLALLVVTAGCSGGGTGSDAAPTADAGDGSDVSGSGGGDGAGDAAGDAAALVENRTAALQAAGSYTSVWRMKALEDGQVVGETSYTVAMNYDTERYTFEMKQASDGVTRTNMAAYFADGRGYQRFGEGDDVTYSASEAEFGMASRAGWMSFGPTVGDLEDLSYEGTETYDGVEVRRYAMSEPASWIAAGGQTGDSGIRWTEFSYEVLVDDDGLVRAEHWSGTGVDESGAEKSVEFSYELSGVGSTDVTEPGWIARADV